MKNKKVKLKDNQIDLKHGFMLELVKHPKGDQYGNLEGFLTHNGEEVDISKFTSYTRFYSDKVEAASDFDNRIIPDYISKNNIKLFKYLTDEQIHAFVKKYLLANKITYGTVIDVIEVLREDGYQIPNNNDKTQVGNLIEFYACVDRLSNEFKKHLISFEFIADRNINNKKDHGPFNKHEKCRNIVFTRYPWTNGFKAMSVINDFVTMTETDLSYNTDIKTFKKVSPDANKYLKNLLSVFNKLNIKTKDTLDNLSYIEIASEFKKYLKENKRELLDIWSKRQPTNYGVYREE